MDKLIRQEELQGNKKGVPEIRRLLCASNKAKGFSPCSLLKMSTEVYNELEIQSDEDYCVNISFSSKHGRYSGSMRNK